MGSGRRRLWSYLHEKKVRKERLRGEGELTKFSELQRGGRDHEGKGEGEGASTSREDDAFASLDAGRTRG